MLSIPPMLWLVKHVQEKDSRVLLVGDSAQHRSVERGDALRILEQSGAVRYVELLQTQRQSGEKHTAEPVQFGAEITVLKSFSNCLRLVDCLKSFRGTIR
jgi:hypothetical protein